jgi:hypothetical protein
VTERQLKDKSLKEKTDILKAAELLDRLRDLLQIFNSTALIHMKYMNLQMYTIKRLNSLALNPEDYNPEGSGKDFLY